MGWRRYGEVSPAGGLPVDKVSTTLSERSLVYYHRPHIHQDQHNHRPGNLSLSLFVPELPACGLRKGSYPHQYRVARPPSAGLWYLTALPDHSPEYDYWPKR